ncbi:hypothetical protein Barb6_03522 [Bacteroidales bacterium Barb6]|nr:hypothetical protein Barb6_03522 [Bacteroidales bacterium Barb6]
MSVAKKKQYVTRTSVFGLFYQFGGCVIAISAKLLGFSLNYWDSSYPNNIAAILFVQVAASFAAAVS